MIAIDTNILVYADRADLSQHAPARSTLEKLSTGLEPGDLPVFAVVEYVRVVTDPRLFVPGRARRNGVSSRIVALPIIDEI